MKKLYKKIAASDMTFESFCSCSSMCSSSCGSCPPSCSATVDLSDATDERNDRLTEKFSDLDSISATVKY